jgi:antimicrobial peptide system SdpB family protein
VSTLTRFWHSLLRVATEFDPRGLPLAFGRLLLALATLSSVIFTPDATLFSDATAVSGGIQCAGPRSLSLWCLNGHLTASYGFARLLTVAVLILVATGFRPRWTCIPHWYVTFSLTASMAGINGGDSAAVIATMLLVPLCLGDERVWQWSRPLAPLPARWRGRSFAAQMVVRLQLSIIYLSGAGSKLLDPAWRDGSAMYFALHDPYFGLPASAFGAVASLLDSRWLVGFVTWAVIAAQLVIAVTVLGRRRERVLAVALVAGLHLGIIVLMGLTSFGIIMIGLTLVALGGPTHHTQKEANVDNDAARQPV